MKCYVMCLSRTPPVLPLYPYIHTCYTYMHASRRQCVLDVVPGQSSCCLGSKVNIIRCNQVTRFCLFPAFGLDCVLKLPRAGNIPMVIHRKFQCKLTFLSPYFMSADAFFNTSGSGRRLHVTVSVGKTFAQCRCNWA